MNASFQIQPVQDQPIDTAKAILLLEVSPDYLLAGIMDDDNKFASLEYFRLEQHDPVNSFKSVIISHEWFSRPYHAVKVIYNFPDSLLVPLSLYDQGNAKASLDLVFGDACQGNTFSDHLPGWDACNIYRVPETYITAINARFKQAESLHLFTVVLKKLQQENSDLAGDNLFLVFNERKLFVTFVKDNRLMLVQTYGYETAEDVSYILLNVCKQFDLDCETVSIHISGLLDDQSSVYGEMRKYFLHVLLDKRPDALKYADTFDEYPAHFFNSIYWSALCV